MHAKISHPGEALDLVLDRGFSPIADGGCFEDYRAVAGIETAFIDLATRAFSHCHPELDDMRAHATAARDAIGLLRGLTPDNVIERSVVSDLAGRLDQVKMGCDYWLLKNLDCVEPEFKTAFDLGVELLTVATEKKYGAEGYYDKQQSIRSATTVMKFLLQADLAGHPTHGYQRVLGYVQAIRDGFINPFGTVREVKKFDQYLQLNGGGNYGQVSMKSAVEQMVGFMNDNELKVGQLAITNMYHAGRCGDWVALAAKEGFLAEALLTVGGAGRVSVPGRFGIVLGTNPVAIGLPNPDGQVPIVADTTTAAEVEGEIRLANDLGLDIPVGLIQTREGLPTTDTGELYHAAPDDRGSILNLGGHRGAALSVVMVLTNSILNGRPIGQDLKAGENEVTMRLTRVDSIVDPGLLRSNIREFRATLNAAFPNDGPEIVLPGEHGHHRGAPFQQRGVAPIPRGIWDKALALQADPDMEIRGH